MEIPIRSPLTRSPQNPYPFKGLSFSFLLRYNVYKIHGWCSVILNSFQNLQDDLFAAQALNLYEDQGNLF